MSAQFLSNGRISDQSLVLIFPYCFLSRASKFQIDSYWSQYLPTERINGERSKGSLVTFQRQPESVRLLVPLVTSYRRLNSTRWILVAHVVSIGRIRCYLSPLDPSYREDQLWLQFTLVLFYRKTLSEQEILWCSSSFYRQQMSVPFHLFYLLPRASYQMTK